MNQLHTAMTRSVSMNSRSFSSVAMSTPTKAFSAPLTGSSTPRLTASTPSRSDRFIPSREINTHAAMSKMSDDDTVTLNMGSVCLSTPSKSSTSTSTSSTSSSTTDSFSAQLAQSLFEGDALNSKILSFKAKAPKPTQFDSSIHPIYSQAQTSGVTAPKRVSRHISPTPERILDAPQLADNYYLNLLDWSSQNQVAVALGNAVYLWNPANGSVDMLMEIDESSQVTSVSWMADGSHLAIGTDANDVQLWNLERKKQVRSLLGHTARVGSLAWNNHVLSSGSADASIFHHDVRVAQHHFATLKGHEQEVCNLKWSHDGTQLASAGNDNRCCIWDVTSTGNTRFTFNDSAAAVKALAWCPWQKNTLATGSGTADRHIRFYNTQSGALVNKIDTQSQVCSLVWSTTEKEILSSHGFSQNQLTVWKYPSLVKVADLTGHNSRVLHTALSPDGTTVCSAAADETMRFWRVWEAASQKQHRTESTIATNTKSSLMALKIR